MSFAGSRTAIAHCRGKSSVVCCAIAFWQVRVGECDDAIASLQRLSQNARVRKRSVCIPRVMLRSLFVAFIPGRVHWAAGWGMVRPCSLRLVLVAFVWLLLLLLLRCHLLANQRRAVVSVVACGVGICGWAAGCVDQSVGVIRLGGAGRAHVTMYRAV